MRVEAAGFVLAGGLSSRMGQNKALLRLEGETLIERALRSLRRCCVDVAIAGGAIELARFGRLIFDGAAGCGPLGGVVAALEQSSHAWNLLLAVDVPFVPDVVWDGLLAIAARTDAIAVMARCEGEVQPLCAAYARDSLPKLREELAAGRWKVTAAVASAGKIEYVDFPEAAWFRNVNTPEEFEALRTG